MKCRGCGDRLRVSRETYRYDASGLKGITLHGIERRQCPRCDEDEIVIPAMGELHRCIARLLVRKPRPLAPEEVRFLREHLGWTSSEFAAGFGVRLETVSRWEHGTLNMSAPADRLLRLIVAVGDQGGDFRAEELREIRRDPSVAARAAFRLRGGGWKLAS